MSLHPTDREPAQNPHTGASPGADSTLSMLAEMESRIAGLKKMHEQAATRDSAIAAREAELQSREQAAQDKLASAARQESEAAAALANIKQQQDEIRLQQDKIATALSDLAEQRKTLAGEKDALAQRLARHNEQQAREDEERSARLSDLEKRLAAREQQMSQRESSHKQQEKALADLSTELEAIERTLDEREASVSAGEAKFSEREKWLVELEASINRRQSEIEHGAQASQSLEAELRKRESGIETRERDVLDREKSCADLNVRRKALEAVEQQAEARLADARQAEAWVEREKAALLERERALSASTPSEETSAIFAGRVEGLQLKLGEATAARAGLESQLQSAMQELERTRDRVQRLEEQASAAPTSEQFEALRRQEQELRAQLAGAQESSKAAEAQARDLRGKLEALSERSSQTLDVETDRLKRELGARDEAVAKAQSREREHHDQLKAARARLLTLETELEHAKSQAESAARDRTQMLANQLAQAQVQADEQATRAGALAQELQAQRQQSQELTARAGELEAQLSQSGDASAAAERIAALEAELSAAQAAAHAGDHQPSREIETLRAEVAKRDQAIELVRQRMEMLAEENAQLQARAEEADSRAAHAAGDAVVSQAEPGVGDEQNLHVHTLRAVRLRKYKQLLQAQARKIVAAQAAIQRRHVDCEQILSQRARLAAVAEDLARREKRAVISRARTSTVATLMYTIASLGLLGGLSWEVSKRIWPGTFVARAEINVDDRGRRLSPESVQAWQKDMNDMIKDPRLMEVVAERMKRRGFESLASSGEVRDLVSKNFYTQSDQPGRMVMELRGLGATQTQMQLDTYVTAFKSVAEESKGERAHDLGVNISKPAATIDEPLLDQRLMQAGMVFGGSILVFGLLGGAMFVRLSAQKKAFDAKQATEAAMAEVDWSALEASVKRTSAAEGKKAA